MRFVSSNRKLVFGAAAGVVALVVGAAGRPCSCVTTTSPSPAPCSPTPSCWWLPATAPSDLHIFRFDATTGEEGAKPLTTGDTNEFNPVLSPDRKMLIYSRET